jgi:hypothetical protein
MFPLLTFDYIKSLANGKARKKLALDKKNSGFDNFDNLLSTLKS